MSSQRFPLPVVEAFATQTRRAIVAYLVDHAQADGSAGRERQWHTLGAIKDETGLSREALRTELSVSNQVKYLLELGLVAVRDPDAQIRHYQLAKTPPSQFIYEYDHFLDVLLELCDSTARQELLTHFLDTEETYTRYALHEELGMSYEALRNHLDMLVEMGIIDSEEGSRSEEYYTIKSPLTTFCWELNDRLAAAFEF